MPKGVINPSYETALAYAIEYGNPASVGMFLKDRAWIKKSGLDEALVVAAWRALRTTGINGFIVESATFRTVVTKGSPSYLEQYQKSVLEDVPPVYESSEHDRYVVEHGAILKSLRWEYRCENQPGRLTSEQLEKCGLKEKSHE